MTIITWPVKNVTNSLKASKINVASTLLSPPPSLRKKDTGHSQHLRISILEGKRDRPLIDGIVVIRAAQTSWSSFLLSEHNTFTTFCPFSPLITLPKFLLPESNLLSLLSLGLNHRTGLHRVITGILTTCWVNRLMIEKSSILMVAGNPELLWPGFFLIKRVSTDFRCIKTEVVITENQSKRK